MATRRPTPDDDDEPLELTEELEADEAPPEDEEGDEGEDEEPGEDEEAPADGDDEGEEETLITFEDEDEAPKEGDSAVIRRIRERNKELARENAELRRTSAPAEAEQLGAKPTFSDCGYDEDKFEEALSGWNAQRSRIEADKATRNAEAEAANREWQRDLESYEERRTKLALPDFDDSAEAVKSSLTLPQQAVIIKAANDPVALVYALGHSDARLAELAKIRDPIKLAAAVARMEGGIKVVKKRRAPAPDRPASGTGKLPGGTDKQLDKLEDEASRTGDRTKVIAYRKRLNARGKGKK